MTVDVNHQGMHSECTVKVVMRGANREPRKRGGRPRRGQPEVHGQGGGGVGGRGVYTARVACLLDGLMANEKLSVACVWNKHIRHELDLCGVGVRHYKIECESKIMHAPHTPYAEVVQSVVATISPSLVGSPQACMRCTRVTMSACMPIVIVGHMLGLRGEGQA